MPDDAGTIADSRAIATMLAEWPRGSLRAWRLDAHALFPAAFRADVQALLLATLGSPDAGDAAAEGCVGEAGPAADGVRGGRCVSARLQNPLRVLHQRGFLEALFQPLLILHMGGPVAPPRATA